MTNGGSIVLERKPAADPAGFIGLEDEVDQHWAGYPWGPCSRR
jgi:type IV secretion system protein TrbI